MSSWWTDPFIILPGISYFPYLSHICYGKKQENTLENIQETEGKMLEDRGS